MMVKQGIYYDPTLVRHTEPDLDDVDAKNTGGQYCMIPILKRWLLWPAIPRG